ncbi:MAG TPA: hypothetical protein VEQ60_18245 [Longimicrobium sp.]|nr:hypothetical protein [Longimicrobium sp.]
MAGRYRDAFTGNVLVSDAAARTIAAEQVLGAFPWHLLERGVIRDPPDPE